MVSLEECIRVLLLALMLIVELLFSDFENGWHKEKGMADIYKNTPALKQSKVMLINPLGKSIWKSFMLGNNDNRIDFNHELVNACVF